MPYLPGLDGLRALAILAVMLYHSEWGHLPGGFLGVEVFFVISGYLITSLLLTEWLVRGRTDLKGFWLRRARRLLPAAFFLIASALAVSVVLVPDEVAGLRGDALAAMAYVTNWHLIFSNQSYFQAMGRPSLLQHLWSLAIEEQFYLIYPPLLYILLRWGKTRRTLFAILLGAVLSIAGMAWLYQPDADPSRAYYGTDTRASALLIGSMLAFVWRPWEMQSPRFSARWLDLAGLAAFAGLLFAFVRLDEFETFLYQGGFLSVALATAVLIAATVHPLGRVGTLLLGGRLQSWIGTRSYSLYLWHWMVFDLTRPQLDVPLEGIPLFVLRFLLTGILAEFSYRCVEMPIRMGALERAWDTLRQAQGAQRRQLGLRWAAGLGAIAVFSIALGESVVSAQVPPPPDYAALMTTETPNLAAAPTVLGLVATPLAQVMTDTPNPTASRQPSTLTPTSTAPASATMTPNPTATHPPSTPSATASAQPSATRISSLAAAPLPAVAAHVTMIGDSVALGAVGELKREIANIDVDAAVGRQMSQAINLLQARRAANQLGSVVVIHMGNNGTFSARQFDQMMSVLSGVPRVVVVNDKVPRAWENVNNAVIAQKAKQYSNVALVDWYSMSEAHPELFWKDGIHLRPEGARAYAALIAASINLP